MREKFNQEFLNGKLVTPQTSALCLPALSLFPMKRRYGFSVTKGQPKLILYTKLLKKAWGKVLKEAVDATVRQILDACAKMY